MAYLTERVAQSFVYNVKTYLYARILRSGVTSAPIGAWKEMMTGRPRPTDKPMDMRGHKGSNSSNK